MKKIESSFFHSDKPLLIDDITIKYSDNKILSYNIINEFFRDSNGRVLIKIDNEKYHRFAAVAFKKLNDSVYYYVFSHESIIDNKANERLAYLAVFNKNKLVDLRNIYSNNGKEGSDNFGSIIFDDKYALFRNGKDDFEYFRIESNGFVYEDEKNLELFNLSFEREKKYKIPFNLDFYKNEKVLWPLSLVNNKKPSQLLREVANRNLKLKKTFFIAKKQNNNLTEYIYLNLLQSQNDESFKSMFEVVKDVYDSNNDFLRNLSLSSYFTMPNNLEIIEVFTLERNKK